MAKEPPIKVDGTILDTLPNATFTVELESGHKVLAQRRYSARRDPREGIHSLGQGYRLADIGRGPGTSCLRGVHKSGLQMQTDHYLSRLDFHVRCPQTADKG